MELNDNPDLNITIKLKDLEEYNFNTNSSVATTDLSNTTFLMDDSLKGDIGDINQLDLVKFRKEFTVNSQAANIEMKCYLIPGATKSPSKQFKEDTAKCT